MRKVAQVLYGSGEMADLTRAFDWGSTPIGPISTWPAELRITLNTLLNSRHPMFLWWGPELIQFYNDAYRLSLGSEKHPKALGQRGKDCWTEIWPMIGPQIEEVVKTGKSIWHEDQLVPILRDGQIQDVWWTHAYSPVLDEEGVPIGVLVTCTETTNRVLRGQEISRQQQSLRVSEERFALVIEAADLGTWDWNLQTGELIWSRRCLSLFGLAANAPMSYALFLDAIHPGDRDRIDRAVRGALKEQRWYAVDMRTIWPDGSMHWVSSHGRAYYDADGNPLRMSGAARDITARKQTEETLRQNSERLRLFIEHAPAAVAMFDREMRYVAASQRWLTDYGLSGEVSGQRHYELLPEIPEHWVDAHRRGLKGETVKAEEDPFLRLDGTMQWLKWEIHPWFRASQEIGGIMIVSEDVTAKREATAALGESQKVFTTLVNHIPQFVWMCTPDGRNIYFNQRWVEYTGLTLEESYGDGWNTPFQSEDKEAASKAWNSAIKTGRPYRIESKLRRFDGSYRSFLVCGEPLRNASGEIDRWFGTCTDIEDLKQTEAALLRSEKLAVVGRLAATISHEINNPLESVTNLLYLINAEKNVEAVHAYAREAQRELSRVSHIVTHTLRFNRQTTAATEERLSALIDSALAIYEARIRNSGVLLRRDYAENDAILCFGSELRQVFANLIGNAFDATRKGGVITLKTQRHHSNLTGAAGVMASVADTGEGISPEIMKHLFEPFFTTKGDNGNGLGLWVSRQILAKHHATVRVKTSCRSGQSGTLLRIWFPLAPPIAEAIPDAC